MKEAEAEGGEKKEKGGGGRKGRREKVEGEGEECEEDNTAVVATLTSL